MDKPDSGASASNEKKSEAPGKDDATQKAKGRSGSTKASGSRTKSPRTLALTRIEDRLRGDTRELDEKHVVSLAESIAAVGLIEPLVVDSEGRLLAGGHRLEAIRLLAAGDLEARITHLLSLTRKAVSKKLREALEQLEDGTGEINVRAIPVRMFEFDSEKEPSLALGVEVAENEKRRDYTRDEIVLLAKQLKAAGYSDGRGRPKKGEKPLQPALSLIVGKSSRHVRRLLGEPEKRTNVRVSDPASKAVSALHRVTGKIEKLALEGSDLPKRLIELASELQVEAERYLEGLQQELESEVPAAESSKDGEAGESSKG